MMLPQFLPPSLLPLVSTPNELTRTSMQLDHRALGILEGLDYACAVSCGSRMAVLFLGHQSDDNC